MLSIRCGVPKAKLEKSSDASLLALDDLLRENGHNVPAPNVDSARRNDRELSETIGRGSFDGRVSISSMSMYRALGTTRTGDVVSNRA
jgi:hypothetical protein